jgi:hypothetical protein
MKKVYTLLMAAAFTANAMAQSAPGSAPASFKSCTSTCTAASTICPAGSPSTVTNFNDANFITTSASNSTAVGAQWMFYNVATDGATSTQVNAIITIESAYRAVVTSFDNNSAKDQNNTNLANLFAPTISPDQVLNNSDRTGYVQFKITFYKNKLTGSGNKWNTQNYLETIQLTGLNYVHYDIDGTTTSGASLRETGLVKELTTTNPAITVNANSELNPYSYTGDGYNWRGFMGSGCDRDNTSNCAEVVAAFKFNGAISTVSFRMGYNYDKFTTGSGFNNTPGRLYGSTFGCFSFPQPVILPVKLLSFSGSYSNSATLLNWETESEVNFDHYEIERGTNGSDFAYAGKVAAQAGDSRKQYSYTDNAASSGNIFYYRLKMVDIDGKSKYSNVIVIRKDAKSINGISINPNPIIGSGAATLRLSSVSSGKIDLRVIDLAGKVVLQQQSRVSEGINSISINNINRLQSGIYTVQVLQKDEAMTTKISIIK